MLAATTRLAARAWRAAAPCLCRGLCQGNRTWAGLESWLERWLALPLFLISFSAWVGDVCEEARGLPGSLSPALLESSASS